MGEGAAIAAKLPAKAPQPQPGPGGERLEGRVPLRLGHQLEIDRAELEPRDETTSNLELAIHGTCDRALRCQCWRPDPKAPDGQPAGVAEWCRVDGAHTRTIGRVWSLDKPDCVRVIRQEAGPGLGFAITRSLVEATGGSSGSRLPALADGPSSSSAWRPADSRQRHFVRDPWRPCAGWLILEQ